jgi:tRNA-specific 2-thiouridylase
MNRSVSSGKKHKSTVVVAMSGGVDSSVAAMLLHHQGYHIIGVTMKLWDYEAVGGNINHESGCCSLESFNDARQICVNMGFPHYVMNFSRDFHAAVVEDFIDEYLSGRTPNPCIQCNIKIKWKTLLEKAEELGADYIATGHYARTVFNDMTHRYELLRAIDQTKDQSYALWGIRQYSLSKTIFPLGHLKKTEVRALARKHRLVTADKKESQEICFVPDNDYHRLLKQMDPDLQMRTGNGPLIDTDGNLIGYHDGYPFYTIGQRRGFGGGFKSPMYVVEIDAKTNTVTVGPEDALKTQRFTVNTINLICTEKINKPIRATIKIRYNDDGHAGTLIPLTADSLEIVFDAPQKSVTPGQSAVFFDEDRVIGGGIIAQSIRE